MDAGLALYLIDHGRYIPRGRQNIHRQGQGSHAVDRNGLMDRQDIALIIRDGLQYQGQQSGSSSICNTKVMLFPLELSWKGKISSLYL